MMNISKEHIDKILSGRWIQTVSFTLTYCIVIIVCVFLVLKNIMKLETFLAMFAGFTTMVALINEWYFKREDRPKESGGVK